MPYLYEFDKDAHSTLLASQVLDASKGVLFGASGLKPDTTNRTILIGLGGTGIRTIDYVKGAISKRLDPSWKRYVGFLGIDSSWSELGNTMYLEASEGVKITRDGVAERMKNAETYPSAVRRFMPEGEQLGSLNSDGCGRTRLAGKIKIHDQAPGSLGVDEEIVNKLVTLKSSVLEPLAGNASGSYEVYVIGSVSGGTCSGSFLEMPALIREAFGHSSKLKINAMLFLPDTLTTLDPQNESQLYANGYASLKELNYYMGMSMRKDYEEKWSYSSKAKPEIALKDDFFNVPYLVGTSNGASEDAFQTAKETIAEFLISLLAKISTQDSGMFLTSAFESNATASSKVGKKLYHPGAAEQEAANEFHEFPKRFAAIGFAEASAPRKLVRAYTVSRACQLAGIKPVSPQDRASAQAAGSGVVVPFRGEDDLVNATEGTRLARDIIAPIEKILNVIHSGNFNFSEDLHETDITWKKIKAGTYDHPAIASKVEVIVQNRTDSDMIDDLRKRIKKAYEEYRNNVKEYVKKEGPFAFVNVFKGRFVPVGEDYGIGIFQMIKNLIEGKTIEGKVFGGWQTVENARASLEMIRKSIINTSAGFLGIQGNTQKTQAAQWVEAYNGVVKARINEVRREATLGPNGALHDSFQIPAAKLADEVGAFGSILVTMTGIYQNHARKMETYDDFRKAQDNKTEVNLAAVNNASYDWLKKQADNTLKSVNAHTLRDNLIDHFFAIGDDQVPNSQRWLEVPENRVKSKNGEVTLTVPDMAIPARAIFDSYLAENFPVTLDVSIETMFVELNQNGVSYDDTANAVMELLEAHSQPQFNGDIPDDSKFSYIMYPSSLESSSEEGPVIAEAIKKAAKNAFSGIQIYASDDADSIMFYQLAAPMEIYRLAELSSWEKHYENGEFGMHKKEAYLHGYSPDITEEKKVGEAVKYIENTRWSDYPSIVRQQGDPRKPDPATGKVSHEGERRQELDRLIAKAKKLGVLYSEKVADGWIVKRVHCDKSTEWKFDIMECQPDPKTGLLPLGKQLALAVAEQNDTSLESISRKVRLDHGGLMDAEHVTEDLAWKFAARTLRAHVPMYIEIRETVKKFEVWAKDIEKHNEDEMKKLQPAKMVYMIKSRIVRRNDDGAWVYVQPNGTQKVVAPLTPVMMKFLAPKDKYLVENGLLGYYLFGKLSAVLNSTEEFDKAFERAKQMLDQLANDGEIDSLTAGEELAAVILAEKESLAEKGARLNGEEADPREKYMKAFAGITDKEKLKEIDVFYFRLGLWEII